jgi:hypothetical protein
MGLVMIFVVCTRALAQTPPSQALTNDDIVNMVEAQLSTNIIVTTIESANVDFDVSPSGLVGLKTAGVEDRIIEAMQTRIRTRDTGRSTDATSPCGARKIRTPGCVEGS